ncbi:MAG: MoxR family ATPase [Gammaproteobacteria bacterium]
MKNTIDQIVTRANTIIFGKEHQIRLALACLLARGHLLIEDLPGMGKTTLSHLLASLLGLTFQRIQFTSDLLPADILGISVYDRERNTFSFHPGPIFSQFILADEVNRSTPKTQSALLEAMEEHQVTLEGKTRQLAEPFFVIATQNPGHHIGTFPLPESQLDRFLMRIEMGYPDSDAERLLLRGENRRDLLKEIRPVISAEELLRMQRQIPGTTVSDALLDYLQALVTFSREAPQFENGLSPRAALSLLRASQAWARIEGRDFVIPEDIQSVLPAVASHRLSGGDPAVSSSDLLLSSVAIP